MVATATNRPPEQLIAELACIGCHKFDEPGPLVGPSLWILGRDTTMPIFAQSILDPNAVIAEGFPPGLMLQDLRQKMNDESSSALCNGWKTTQEAKTQ